MGNNLIKFQYYDLDESSAGARNGADMWAIGLDHFLAKKTIVYFTYASLDNQVNGSVDLFDGRGFDERRNNDVSGTERDGWAIGMRHRF